MTTPQDEEDHRTESTVMNPAPQNTLWKEILDWTLLLILILLVVYAFIDGQFIKKEITVLEVCNGMPYSVTWPNGTLEKLNLETMTTSNVTIQYARKQEVT